MKKLNFILAALLISGLTFAQTHISTVVQTDVKQKAVVDQKGPGPITSHVTQSNEKNLATVTQINPLTAPTNSILSDVLQSGMLNKATVTQHHNGTAGQLGLIQALVNQTGNYNEAIQKQGPNGQMGTDYAEIVQSGNWNNASQHQLRYANNAKINQSGNRNTAMQAQDASADFLDDFDGSANIALIDQSGNFNLSEQSQDGWANEVKAYQSGDNNISKQKQIYNSWKSIAYVEQSGNVNEAYQDQVGNLNKAYIAQKTKGNYAEQDQKSLGSRASAVYNPLNYAEIVQWGGNGNSAIQNQDLPIGLLAVAIGGNEAITWQNGSANTATQDQYGISNYSSVTQTGVGHLANATQSDIYVQP